MSMCGRYTLRTPVERLAEEFGFEGSSVEIPANYNVAPTQSVATVLEEDGQRRLEVLRWGLIPPWADDPQIGSRMINARSETAPEKDRKSTRLNSSHANISYAVFCLIKKTRLGPLIENYP